MRILSLHPVTTELLFAIGAGSMVVGRTDACDYPEAALKVPSIGSEVTPDQVAIFEPDLVLTSYGQQELSGALMATCNVARFIPDSIEGISAGIAALGELVGKQVEADMVIHDLQALLERATLRTARYRPVRVYCEIPDGGPGYINEIVTALGGEAYLAETRDGVPGFDPHIIIVSIPGEDNERALQLVAAREGWSGISAVRLERMFVVDPETLHRPGPRLQQGIRRLAKLLHGVDLGTQD